MATFKEIEHFYKNYRVYLLPDSTITDGWLENTLKKYPGLEFAPVADTEYDRQQHMENGHKPLLYPLSRISKEDEIELGEIGYCLSYPSCAIRDQEAERINDPTVFDLSRLFAFLISKHYNVFNLPESEFIDPLSLPVNPYVK